MTNIPRQYKPLSPWTYFGYNILFNIPFIGAILLIVFSFDNSNINRRNYARSYWCTYLLIILLIIIFIIVGISIRDIIEVQETTYL